MQDFVVWAKRVNCQWYLTVEASLEDDGIFTSGFSGFAGIGSPEVFQKGCTLELNSYIYFIPNSIPLSLPLDVLIL